MLKLFLGEGKTRWLFFIFGNTLGAKPTYKDQRGSKPGPPPASSDSAHGLGPSWSRGRLGEPLVNPTTCVFCLFVSRYQRAPQPATLQRASARPARLCPPDWLSFPPSLPGPAQAPGPFWILLSLLLSSLHHRALSSTISSITEFSQSHL